MTRNQILSIVHIFCYSSIINLFINLSIELTYNRNKYIIILLLNYDHKQSIVINLLHFTFFIYNLKIVNE